MGAGIRLALRDLWARRRMYRENGISAYRPRVVLMTAGAPDDDWEQAADEMRDLGERGKIQYIGIEIGDKADHELLCRILPSRPGPVKLNGFSFKQFFGHPIDETIYDPIDDPPVSEEERLRWRDIEDWGDL